MLKQQLLTRTFDQCEEHRSSKANRTDLRLKSPIQIPHQKDIVAVMMMMSDTSSGKLFAAAVSLCCAGLGYHYGVVKRRKARKAKTCCACGKVEIDIEQPPANFSYFDASCIQCTCPDCLGFCEEVLKQGSSKLTIKDLGEPGVATTLFYDSELRVVKGEEYLESMKLSEGSENRRIYSSCCGTPIAIANTGAPLNLVYCCNIKTTDGQDSVNLTASCCFHSRKTDSVPPGSKIRMINGAFAPRTILEIISRMAFLAVFGSYGPGNGIPSGSDKTVGIGMDSIKVSSG